MLLNTKIEEKGITLIALVVTIIVLLILAGVTINLVAGQNGIIHRTMDVAEASEMSQIKERAEMVKMGLEIDNLSKPKSERIQQNVLLNAINEEFEGSRYIGTKVITADEKYDILVEEGLEIIVMKHQESDEEGEIALSYTAVPQHKCVKIIVVPSVQSENSVLSYSTWAQLEIDKLSTDPTIRRQELESIFVEGDVYYYPNDYLNIQNPTIEDVVATYGYESLDDLLSYINEYDSLDL